MKKYPKIVQCDKRGQIVIPKDVRADLGVEEGTGFFMYVLTEEGILLKKVNPPELSEQDKILDEIEEKSDKINVDKKNIEKSKEDYKKDKEGGFDLI